MGYRKLGRTSDQRKAMLRNLATSLTVSERIETTEVHTKEVRSVVEKLVTLDKKGDLTSHHNTAETLRSVKILNEDDSTQTALQKLFGEVTERYSERQDDYTRILKVSPRRGDGAESVIIELV